MSGNEVYKIANQLSIKSMIRKQSPIFLPLALILPAGAANLIESTCQHTPYYQLCVESFQMDPRSATADPKGLAVIIVNATTAKAAEVLTNTISLLRLAGPGEAPPRYYCSPLYIPMVSQILPLTIKALHQHQFREADQSLRRAGTVPQLCKRKFAGMWPLADGNTIVYEIIGVSVGEVDQLGI